MREVLQDDVKDALVLCLRDKFPTAKFYKDGEVKNYPCFYVLFTNVFLKPISLKSAEKYRMEFYVKIEYREALESSSVIGLNTKLDNVGMILLDCLRKVKLYGKEYFLDITNNESVDQIRIFEGNFALNVTYEIEREVNMRRLKMKESGIKP